LIEPLAIVQIMPPFAVSLVTLPVSVSDALKDGGALVRFQFRIPPWLFCPLVQLPFVPPYMPEPKKGIIPPPTPDTEVIVTVEPIGNCVCGLKEPLALCADASEVIARSPAKARTSKIPAVIDFDIFCINFTS